jgi:hypothetical protein
VEVTAGGLDIVTNVFQICGGWKLDSFAKEAQRPPSKLDDYITGISGQDPMQLFFATSKPQNRRSAESNTRK